MLTNKVTWLLGLMLAPHTLALLGNTAATLQGLTPFAIGAGAICFWLNGQSLVRWSSADHPADNISNAKMLALKHLPVQVLFYSGRIVATVSIATVLLVTAGFVFNETFAYWFPNFAFAFLLLGVVVFIHMLGPKAAQRVQNAFIGISLAGIILLTVWGVVGSQPPLNQPIAQAPALSVRAVWSILLLFVGFDLWTNTHPNDGSQPNKPVFIGLLLAGILFALWAAVSVEYVPAAKLADSFIPHTLAARAMAGQAGRLVMGVVLISGACAAVNALLWDQTRSLSELTKRFEGSLFSKPWFRRLPMGSFLAGVIIAAMMVTGLAGTDSIDTYVRTGLYLWLFYYGAVHLVVLMPGSDQKQPLSAIQVLISLVGLATMTIGGAMLIATDPQPTLVLKVALPTVAVMTIAVLASRMRTQKMMCARNGVANRPKVSR